FIYNPDDIIPGKTRTAYWGLLPNDVSKDARAILTFTDKKGNDTTITILYFAPKLNIEPPFASFGIVKGGSLLYRDFWIYNLSPNKPAVIKNLDLKYKNRGFSIFNVTLPTVIPPLDSLKFSVKFSMLEEGTYTDSIMIDNGCMEFSKAMLHAEVANSIIEVSDINFEDFPIRKTKTEQFTIKNKGNIDLLISGYELTHKSVFKVHLPPVSKSNPIKIAPEGELYFNVDFTPELETQYIDSIVFHSDAHKIDSVCRINANGVQPGMIATSTNWGRKRIGLTYPADSSVSIILENTTNFDVQVYGIAVKSEKNSSAFYFDKDAFKNITIPGGEKFAIPVHFFPQSVGEFELVIVYDNSVNSQTETRLYGVGVKPYLETSNVDFDTSVVNQFSNPRSNTVRFRNVNWDYSDTLTIYDIMVLRAGDEISTSMDKYGTAGYKYDKGKLNLPKTLLPGEILEIPVYFVAPRKGLLTAELRSLSDAETDASSILKGYGIVEGIRVTTDFIPHICFGKQDTVTCSIENIGNEGINVTSIVLNQNENHFIFENSADALGFNLNPSQTEKVRLIFDPLNPGKKVADLIVYNTTMEDFEHHRDVQGDAVQIPRVISVDVPEIQQTPSFNDPVECSVYMQPGEELDFADIKQLSVKIKYNPHILKADSSHITVGNLLDGIFQINNLIINDMLGEITLTIDTLDGIPGKYLKDAGELLKINFTAYYPTAEHPSKESVISAEIKPVNSVCVDFTDTKTTTVTLNPVCMDNFFKIIISSDRYFIHPVAPNPVFANEIKLDYSIGYAEFVEITLYNSYGELISIPVASKQKAGTHRVSFPASDLASGVYFCTMKAGPFYSYQKFIVAK
ncbi:MAG: T9SS type A sorting domain-containing protein, partial [Bacteroidota bacterium]